MSFAKLYEYIKPLIDIYIYKYFGEKKEFIFKMFKLLEEKAIESAKKSSVKFETCQLIFKLYYYTIFIFFLILIIWIIYYTLQINSTAISYNIGIVFKDQIKLNDILSFKQIDNLIYITDNFSFDYLDGYGLKFNTFTHHKLINGVQVPFVFEFAVYINASSKTVKIVRNGRL